MTGFNNVILFWLEWIVSEARYINDINKTDSNRDRIYCDISFIERSDELYIYNCVIDERLKFDHEIDKIGIHIIKMLI